LSGKNSFRTTVVGLTGGIAAGKNFVADIFAKNGAIIFDADKEVHQLLESDKSTVEEVVKNFSESLVDGKIDRKILAKIVFSNEEKLRILEKILHPKVRQKYQEFLADAQKQKIKLVVLNVPLLLESEGYKSDYIVAITAPLELRKKRYLLRSKNSDLTTFNKIRRKQLSDLERKKRADFVIRNIDEDLTSREVKKITDFLL
jgi:dephospho-CoA kinase